MASNVLGSNRREFLKTGLAAGAATLFGRQFAGAAQAGAGMAMSAPTSAVASSLPSKVAVTHGDNRMDNIFRALKSLDKEIAQAIGNKRVIIKPNNVSTTNQLASTHVDALVGILEFLKSIGKLNNVIIAESSTGRTMQGYENFGYMKLVDQYKVKLIDLDEQPYHTIMGFDQTDTRPRAVRVSSMLANQAENYIISACMLKTHDRAVATMSIKNIVFGAPLKLPNPNAGANANMASRGGFGARGGRGGRGGFGGGFNANDKPILHGGGAYGININIAMLAPMLHPSLSVIDGYEGMEGQGPMRGTRVDHRVCVASTDYVAADCVGASLMGIDPMDIGYLYFLGNAKMGQSDLGKMEILGESIASLARKYELGRSIEQQFGWKQAAQVTPI